MLTGFLYPLRLDGFINSHDEGIWISLSQALLDGHVLYRDLWFQYGPVLTWPLEGAFSLRPPTLGLIRAVAWVVNVMGLCLIYFSVLRWIRDDGLRIAASVFVWLLPLAAFTLTIPYPARYGSAFLAVLFWPKQLSSPWKTAWFPVLAGSACAAVFLVSQEVGFSIVIATLWVYWAHDSTRRSFWRCLAAMAISLGVALVFMQWRYGLAAYIRCTVFETGYTVAKESLRVPNLDWHGLRAAWEGQIPWAVGLARFGDGVAIYFPLIVNVALALYLTLKRRWGEQYVLAGLLVFAALSSMSAWGRSDRWHIYFSLSSSLFLWVFFAAQRSTRWKVLFLLMGALLTIPHFHSKRNREKNVDSSLRRLDLDRGGLARIPVSQALAYEQLNAWVQRNTSPHESFLFYPYDGALYFFSNRRIPCRYPILAEAVHPRQQQDVVRDLEAASVPWVIWDRQNTMFDGVPIDEFIVIVFQYLRAHYRPVEEIGPFLILKRTA